MYTIEKDKFSTTNKIIDLVHIPGSTNLLTT